MSDDNITPEGTSGVITANGMAFEVTIISARKRYGHIDYLVEPKAGSGSRWVERTKVAVVKAM